MAAAAAVCTILLSDACKCGHCVAWRESLYSIRAKMSAEFSRTPTCPVAVATKNSSVKSGKRIEMLVALEKLSQFERMLRCVRTKLDSLLSTLGGDIEHENAPVGINCTQVTLRVAVDAVQPVSLPNVGEKRTRDPASSSSSSSSSEETTPVKKVRRRTAVDARKILLRDPISVKKEFSTENGFSESRAIGEYALPPPPFALPLSSSPSSSSSSSPPSTQPPESDFSSKESTTPVVYRRKPKRTILLDVNVLSQDQGKIARDLGISVCKLSKLYREASSVATQPFGTPSSEALAAGFDASSFKDFLGTEIRWPHRKVSLVDNAASEIFLNNKQALAGAEEDEKKPFMTRDKTLAPLRAARYNYEAYTNGRSPDACLDKITFLRLCFLLELREKHLLKPVSIRV